MRQSDQGAAHLEEISYLYTEIKGSIGIFGTVARRSRVARFVLSFVVVRASVTVARRIVSVRLLVPVWVGLR